MVAPAGMPLPLTVRPAPSVAGEPIDETVDCPFVSVPVWLEVKVSSFTPPAEAALERVMVTPLICEICRFAPRALEAMAAFAAI
jgi:hypothetical protein